MSGTAETLAAAGMSAAEAARKQELFARAERALRGSGASRKWFVPGRIEVLGKHTDYAGGRSLLCAAERGFCVVARTSDDGVVRVADAVRDSAVRVPMSREIEIPAGWGNYVATAVRRVARNFPGAHTGAEIAFASDLPASAGMSSSSALMVAIFTAIAAANRLEEREDFAAQFPTPERLAEYLGCIENGQSYGALAGDGGVGTFGGSEDHTAMLCCKAGEIAQYGFCPVTLERRIRVPASWVFAIANSGVVASKTGGARDAYNQASLAAAAVLDTWRTTSGRTDATLASAVRSAPDAPDRIRAAVRKSRHSAFAPRELQRRFEQFLLESEVLIPQAAAAIGAADERGVADVVGASQGAAETWLRNQVPETIALAGSARQLGAIAASAFGAGFGGSVWALVRRSDAPEFLAAWRTEYANRFPAHAARSEFFLTSAGPALTEL